jgi:hypothetical protein
VLPPVLRYLADIPRTRSHPVSADIADPSAPFFTGRAMTLSDVDNTPTTDLDLTAVTDLDLTAVTDLGITVTGSGLLRSGRPDDGRRTIGPPRKARQVEEEV